MAKRGRPQVMNEKTIRILEDAFLNGATDREAIFIADISSTTFYDYCKAHPDFTERIDGLRDMAKYQAKKNIISKINKGSVFESQWYLERKAKDEFSTRSELTGKDGKDILPTPLIKLDALQRDNSTQENSKTE